VVPLQLNVFLTELSLDILLFVTGKLDLAGPFSVRSSMILANCCKVCYSVMLLVYMCITACICRHLLVLFVYLVDNSCHFLNWENIYILVVNPEFINVMICHALKFFLSLWSSVFCLCVCLYIYIYIEREREREREISNLYHHKVKKTIRINLLYRMQPRTIFFQTLSTISCLRNYFTPTLEH
jgi:hypothetical protein